MNTLSETILLTGGTGQVGMALLPRLLAAPDTRVMALVRARDAEHADLRRREMVESLRLGAAGERLIVVRGDVTREHLALAPADRARVVSEVTSILHSAASVRFDMPEETATQENLRSTENVLILARELAERGRLRRHDHISTAAAIHRPSIVVGDSHTGETRAFNVLYWPLKLYARGLFSVFPGRADTRVDAVPVDWVAASITALRLRPDTVGRCFHEAAGDDALTVGDLAEHIAALVGRRPLRFVDQGMYRKYIRPVLKPLLSLHPKGRAIIRGGNAYMPYFMGNPLFDTTELRAALGEAGRAPPILDYLSRVVGYAQARDFGRR